ncbi:MAG: hypothetical protein AAFN59_14570 [Pseudomonadota bacterium]
MDLIALGFYAVICGLLSLFAPRFGGLLPRVAIGATVGIAASIALPILKGAMGAY